MTMETLMPRSTITKSQLVLGLLLLLLPRAVSAAWNFQQRDAGTNISFRAVQAVSSKVVWVGGSSGTIIAERQKPMSYQ